MLRKLKWQLPGEPLASRYNWCQGPLPGRDPAVEKHWIRVEHCWKHTERGKQKYSGQNLSLCHLVHYESHTDWPGFEPGPFGVEGRRTNAWNLPLPSAWQQAAAVSYQSLTWVWFMILTTSFDSLSTSALKGNSWIIQRLSRGQATTWNYVTAIMCHA